MHQTFCNLSCPIFKENVIIYYLLVFTWVSFGYCTDAIGGLSRINMIPLKWNLVRIVGNVLSGKSEFVILDFINLFNCWVMADDVCGVGMWCR